MSDKPTRSGEASTYKNSVELPIPNNNTVANTFGVGKKSKHSTKNGTLDNPASDLALARRRMANVSKGQK